MHFWPWALSVDSLIVAIALSTTRPWRHSLPLIAWFGICDAAASTIGPTLWIQMTTFSLLIPAFLVLWGGLINEPVGELRPAPSGFFPFDRDRKRLTLADRDDALRRVTPV